MVRSVFEQIYSDFIEISVETYIFQFVSLLYEVIIHDYNWTTFQYQPTIFLWLDSAWRKKTKNVKPTELMNGSFNETRAIKV
ncbi:unnamed protein product [Caenorhabditis angaria]|uniref:Uncharacterized protein n=1 Tax=Caenorhabditis angaria TaxID=860376 RepID=A0A9P1MSI1_9PELO|nr:unnamed protein product [Caenorhabditis angaria]